MVNLLSIGARRVVGGEAATMTGEMNAAVPESCSIGSVFLFFSASQET